MDGLRLRMIAGGAALAVAAGVGAAAAPRGRLVDGSLPPRVPNALRKLDRPVLTSVRVAPPALRSHAMRSCLRKLGERPRRGAAIVERVGLAGRSVTYTNARRALLACDGTEGRGWCGVSAGALIRRRLRDPRLDIICRNRARRIVAFVWVQPPPRTRWVAVAQGAHTELYPAAGRQPIRIASARRVDLGHASARFVLSDYDRAGRLLARERIEARVAG